MDSLSRRGVGATLAALPLSAALAPQAVAKSRSPSARLIAATHMPCPGVGRILGNAGVLRWLPADWSCV